MYYLVYGFLFLLSLLPLQVLYLLSDFAYFILYHVVGYRKKVVMHNLSIAFPEKKEEERRKIARQFYRNFADTFIEAVKLISASESFVRKHFYGDFSLFSELYEQGKKCQLHLGHIFNWEMANAGIPLNIPYTMLTVYMPISSKAIDLLFQKIRSRTGAKLLPATKMNTAILPYRNQLYLMGLVGDQNPGAPSNAYWFNFFGKPTPFVKGLEKGARVHNTAVVFCYLVKKKRGYYEAHHKLITTEPRNFPETELTRLYVSFLENAIRANPSMWLWSHRRWKHEWKPEYGKVHS